MGSGGDRNSYVTIIFKLRQTGWYNTNKKAEPQDTLRLKVKIWLATGLYGSTMKAMWPAQ